ncbi:MAG: hypothetical protein ABID63_09530 [Pseudomonadota bacterium]
MMVLIVSGGAGFAQENNDEFVMLQTNLQPPYQHLQNGLLQGYSIGVLNCAFDRIGVDYGIAIAPRQRNREMVRNGQADGFFLAELSPAMAEYAEPSLPLALEKWVWISAGQAAIADGRFPESGKLVTVGAVLGSSEAEWVTGQGYGDVVRPPSVESLISLVRNRRIDFALIDNQTFDQARAEMGLPVGGFSRRFERYAPLVVYFARDYVARYPQMLHNLNAAIPVCGTMPMVLEDWERSSILAEEATMIRKWAMQPDLVSAVREMVTAPDAKRTDTQIADINRRWEQAEDEGGMLPEARQLAQNRLSEILHGMNGDLSRSIAEIFVFDRRGLILGMNRLTSNYDQSDEDKYKIYADTARDKASAIRIADIAFDASTGKFLSQVTVPVIDDKTGAVIAAMTVGLDVSAALRPQS